MDDVEQSFTLVKNLGHFWMLLGDVMLDWLCDVQKVRTKSKLKPLKCYYIEHFPSSSLSVLWFQVASHFELIKLKHIILNLVRYSRPFLQSPREVSVCWHYNFQYLNVGY